MQLREPKIAGRGRQNVGVSLHYCREEDCGDTQFTNLMNVKYILACVVSIISLQHTKYNKLNHLTSCSRREGSLRVLWCTNMATGEKKL